MLTEYTLVAMICIMNVLLGASSDPSVSCPAGLSICWLSVLLLNFPLPKKSLKFLESGYELELTEAI